MKKAMKNLMKKADALVLVAAPPVELADVSAARNIPVDPEVVATAKRRQFSGSERRRILAAADRCTAPGEIGALLRREGIYSSMLAALRQESVATGHSRLGSHQRGRQAHPGI